MAYIPAPVASWSPSPEQRRQAALHFDRGNQLVATGDSAAGVRLLLDCCRLDPANLLYRQALRRAQKTHFGNRRRAGWLAWLRAWPLRARLRVARRAGRYIEMLRIGERILARDPWNIPVQIEMARAAEVLGLLDVAVWNLEQARHVEPNDPAVNRRLARLYERRGNFTQSLDLWTLVRKAAPDDEEAVRKLAATPPPCQAASSPDPLQRESAHLRARLAEDPTRATTYRDLARLYRQAGLLEPAHAVLLDGLAATGNAFDLTVELAELQIEPFRQDLAHAEQKIAVHADDDLRRIQADLRREINTREMDLFRLLADRYPGRAQYRYEVGVRLLKAGQLDEAMTTLIQAQADPAYRGPALIALGQCRRGRNDARRALVCFEEALQALPADAGRQRLEAIYEMARCHADLGEWPRAVDLACDLVRLDPAHGDIARLLEDWQSRSRGR
jgi:tetratricopeptide (TPR) repeat protein